MNLPVSQDQIFSVLFIITALICFGSIVKLGKKWEQHKVFTLGALLTGLGFLLLGCTAPLSLPEKVQQITKTLEFVLIVCGLITMTIPPTFGNAPTAGVAAATSASDGPAGSAADSGVSGGTAPAADSGVSGGTAPAPGGDAAAATTGSESSAPNTEPVESESSATAATAPNSAGGAE